MPFNTGDADVEYETIVDDGEVEAAANKKLEEIRKKHHPSVHIEFDDFDEVTGVVDLAITRMKNNRTSTPPQGIPVRRLRRRLRKEMEKEEQD